MQLTQTRNVCVLMWLRRNPDESKKVDVCPVKPRKRSCCWNKTCPAAETLSGTLRLFQWENESCVFHNLPAYSKTVEQLVPYHKSKEKLLLSKSEVYCWCLRGTIFSYSSSQMCWIYLRTALGLLSVKKMTDSSFKNVCFYKLDFGQKDFVLFVGKTSWRLYNMKE